MGACMIYELRFSDKSDGIELEQTLNVRAR